MRSQPIPFRSFPVSQSSNTLFDSVTFKHCQRPKVTTERICRTMRVVFCCHVAWSRFCQQMFCYLRPWRHTVIASCTKPFPDSCKHKRHWNFHTGYGCIATRRENCTEGLFCNTKRMCRSRSSLFAGSQLVNMGFLKNCIPHFGTQKSFVCYATRIPITFLEQFAFDPILSHMNPVCVSDTVLQ